jgi:hypothetical protein
MKKTLFAVAALAFAATPALAAECCKEGAPCCKEHKPCCNHEKHEPKKPQPKGEAHDHAG